MSPELILVVVCAGALGVLLTAEYRERRGLKIVAKAAASAAFVALGALRWMPGDTFGAWTVLGLLLSAGGDLALALPRGLPAGMGLFLAAHLTYLAAWHALLPVGSWPWGILAPLVLVAVLVVRWLWPHLGRLRWAVAAYITVITLMVWGALSLWRSGGAAQGGLVAAGAVLFWLSDLAVARNRFVSKAFVNRAVGLPVYYAAQLLLAFAVGMGAGGGIG